MLRTTAKRFPWNAVCTPSSPALPLALARAGLRTQSRTSASASPFKQFAFCRALSTEAKDDIKDAEIVEPAAADDLDGAQTLKSEKVGETDEKTSPEDLEIDMEGMHQTPESDSFVDVSTEAREGETKKMGFQAETKQILDIMAKSLYTDREVFLRELISNASDALEKARYAQQTDGVVTDSEVPFEMKIYTNEKDKTLIIQDFGIGMNESEIVENLGTIAKSGSKAFAQMSKETVGQDGNNIIGQFGVGFYSVFMVSDKVEVYSMGAKIDSEPIFWTSDGSGSYELGKASGCKRGTKIIIHLKEDAKEFAIKHVVEGIVKKYSNFVGFPIYLNDSKVNTVAAIWKMNANEVTEDQHNEFYRYIGNAYDTPITRMHFKTDAPIDINALFYFPERHMEKYGMGRLDPGVSLYSRKVLIQAKCAAILPDWLRFIKGVVDSEDIPLNISRENMQDSALIQRMNNVLTKRVIRFLDTMSKKENDKFHKFWNEFANFIKEGVCTDVANKDEIARLLRYDTSLGEDKPCSLDDYIGRMPPDQQEIFYLYSPSRKSALASPYFEAFDSAGTEVIFVYSHIDDFVMKNLTKYSKRKLVSIESGKATPNSKAEADKTAEEKESEKALEDEGKELCEWFTKALSKNVSSVKTTLRLKDSPAIVVDHESAAVRKMMKYVESMGHQEDLPKQKLEINPKHPIMQNLLVLKDTNPELATLVSEQVFDNALIAADIMDNPRMMLNRLNQLLTAAADAKTTSAGTSSKVEESSPKAE